MKKTYWDIYAEIIKTMLFTLLCVQMASCTRNSSSEKIFRVGVRVLPERLDPRNNEVNVFHYINTHLYYPLFEFDPYHQLISHFLDMKKTVASSSDFKTYQMCLIENLKFTDDSLVTSTQLKQAITFAHTKNLELPDLVGVNEKGRCIELQLSKAEPKYFHKLTSIESTLLKAEPSENLKVPIGVGPFLLKEFTSNKISISRQHNDDHTLSQVDFIKINDPKEGDDLQIHDWNHLWQHLGSNSPIPNYVKTDWRKFEQNLVRSLMLVLHVKDVNLRRKINYCFNSKKYLDTVGITVTETPGFLPSGLAGSNVSFNEIKKKWSLNESDCKLSNKISEELPFYLFYPSIETQVRSFFDSIQSTLPVKVKVKVVTLNEAIRLLFSKEDLIIATMADTMKVSPTGFFSAFVGKNIVEVEPIPGLDKLIRSASISDDLTNSDALFAEAHKKLLESGTIIPLGQIRATYYYPPFIKNIPLVDPANGFPRLDQVEVY